MRTAKSWFGLVLALLPVLYLGGLLFYFNNVRSMFGGLADKALMPVILGLGALLLLFLAPVGLRFWKLARGGDAPPPGAARAAEIPEEERSDFDADAALARYLARRSGEPGAPPPSFGGSAPARPAGSFGRKGS